MHTHRVLCWPIRSSGTRDQCSRSGGHLVLRDDVVHRPGNDAGETDIADLAGKIFVKEDVSRLEISMDKGFRFHLV